MEQYKYLKDIEGVQYKFYNTLVPADDVTLYDLDMALDFAKSIRESTGIHKQWWPITILIPTDEVKHLGLSHWVVFPVFYDHLYTMSDRYRKPMPLDKAINKIAQLKTMMEKANGARLYADYAKCYR